MSDPALSTDDVINSRDVSGEEPISGAKWIIENWTGRRVFTDEAFDSFDEARGFISDYASSQVCSNCGAELVSKDCPNYGLGEEHALTEYSEDAYDGICEDLYAVVDPNQEITLQLAQTEGGFNE